ncbi:M15 family metallopeptidase [Sandarakinorhabdus sp.]|uniref:M15 family metallopeptidase n=1 Tax=Sandarakinorhabdus sp. TaxID=1916663 RepID=UPI003F72C401
MAIYRVTASLLHLRTSADRASNSLAIMKAGTIISGTADDSPTPGWTRGRWNGIEGYAASQFLERLAALDPVPVTVGPPVNVDRRDVDMAKLHPIVRDSVAQLLRVLNDKAMPFRVFEAYRAPERQRHLHAQGRSRPGMIITRARAWESYHQYGLAADIVLFVEGKWSWDTSGARAAMWKELQVAAASLGLETLSFERPHVQLKGVALSQLLAGRMPDGGDVSWFNALSEAAARWTAAGGSPPPPSGLLAERPPLDQLAS